MAPFSAFLGLFGDSRHTDDGGDFTKKRNLMERTEGDVRDSYDHMSMYLCLFSFFRLRSSVFHLQRDSSLFLSSPLYPSKTPSFFPGNGGDLRVLTII